MTNHGGRRQGAGRPEGATYTNRVTVMMSDEQVAYLQSLDETMSEFIRRKVDEDMLSNEDKNEALDCYRSACENGRITSDNPEEIENETEFEASERGHSNSVEMAKFVREYYR